MKKIIIALIVLISLSFVSAHTGNAEAPAGTNETMLDGMQEHHKAMHSTYGNEFYCDAEGCASGNMMGGQTMMGGQNMMSGMGYGLFGGFGFILPVLLVILLIILIIYFSLRILKEIKKK